MASGLTLLEVANSYVPQIEIGAKSNVPPPIRTRPRLMRISSLISADFSSFLNWPAQRASQINFLSGCAMT
jgi:hypothetical protein